MALSTSTFTGHWRGISCCRPSRVSSRQYPDLQLFLSERGVGWSILIKEGVDCVLRVGELPNSGMVARRVAMLEEGTFVSPAYVACYGEVRTLDDLEKHRIVAFVSSAIGHVLPLEFTVAGKLRHLTPAVAVSVTAAETMVEAARLGLGLIQVPKLPHRQGSGGEHTGGDLAGRLLPSPTPVSRSYIRAPASLRRGCGCLLTG